jgi:hypothetical protein
MPDAQNETRYIKLSDACSLLNRDVDHIQEFLGDSEIAIETVDDELCIDADALIEHIADTISDLADDENSD